jgi:hypothetical protein
MAVIAKPNVTTVSAAVASAAQKPKRAAACRVST